MIQQLNRIVIKTFCYPHTKQMTSKAFDMYEDGEHGDALHGQLQYEKYIKCHVYRIHPGSFGNHCCDDQWQGNSGGGGCGGHGQDGDGCIGPGDPGMPGHGWSFTYAEVVNDQAPCMDFQDVCTPFKYGFDMLNGNKKFDHGDIDDPAPCLVGSPRDEQSICYSYNYSDTNYNPNYNG